jgi:hypothetical protein
MNVSILRKKQVSIKALIQFTLPKLPKNKNEPNFRALSPVLADHLLVSSTTAGSSRNKEQESLISTVVIALGFFPPSNAILPPRYATNTSCRIAHRLNKLFRVVYRVGLNATTLVYQLQTNIKGTGG